MEGGGSGAHYCADAVRTSGAGGPRRARLNFYGRWAGQGFGRRPVRARATLGASQGVTTKPERLTGGAATLPASSGLKTVCVAIAGIALGLTGT